MDSRHPRPTLLAAVWSALAAVLGAWWWAVPAAYPFARPGDDGFPTLLDLLPPSVVPPVITIVGLVALAASVARSRPVLIAVGTAAAVGFGLLAAGLAPLALAGYAMAMLGPFVLAGTLVAGARRWRGGPVAVAALVAVAAAAWIGGIADGDVLRRYAGVVTGSAAKIGPPAALTFLLLGGVLWGVLAVRLAVAGRARPAWAHPSAAARWGRVAAVVAAACPLPYAAVRMTWLTPWPLGISAADLVAEPEIRLHGLLLGLSALAGSVLTLGLVSRWGEVWPRWVPIVRGRVVPVRAAVVPGAIVATLVGAAAVPTAIQALTAGEPAMLLIFPFWLWGPALGAAVLGYALRRRSLAESRRS